VASADRSCFDPFAPIFHHFAMTANGLTLSIYWDGALVGSVDYLGSLTVHSWLAIEPTFSPPAILS
jgi:hypothetical protein